MLHEAFYPSELSDNHPVKIYYGFVQEGIEKNYELTLVVFYPKLTGTSLFNLSEENKAGLANFLLKKHLFGVKASFIRVAYLCEHVNEKDFYGESWGVDVFEGWAHEELSNQTKTFWKYLGKNAPATVSINSRNLTIGLTDKVKLIEHRELNCKETGYLLERLKHDDFGKFEKVFKELNHC